MAQLAVTEENKKEAREKRGKRKPEGKRKEECQ
jgi:hypothetical protein